ncbi:SIMPL domain-containing protein [Natronospira bacteriovora]|uniref:SIMPL domain-containing protein n=1 Tax=Natronospira bacteriovora TaxID=3069753 RepID=A0ABU0W4R7_9GAMM|nr:SIMPL domain-containing protein [Natronospira sp. AB-CW4]MDQ2068976.1 SIMPL domain-containing protein [Natronospira sp. AB-CW4]
MKYHPRTFSCVLITLLAVALAGCNAATTNGGPDTVTVTGSAERQQMPDYYQVHLLLVERGEDGTALAGPLENRLDRIMAIARDYGLADEDIRAWEVQLRQESHWDREQQRRVLGEMRLSREVRLNVDADLDVGALLGDLLVSGAGELQRVQSRLQDPRAIQQALLAEATADARQRAAAIARGDERELGRLIRAEEASGFERLMVTGSRMEQADTAIRFEPEPISLSATVNATFKMGN